MAATTFPPAAAVPAAATPGVPPPPLVPGSATPSPGSNGLPYPGSPGPAAATRSGSYTGHVLTVLALCGISALVWIGSSALALLVITLDSFAIAGATASESSPVLFNLIIFGWVGPALVLLVGLLGAQGLGQRKAKMATAGVLLVHLLVTALILAVAT